MRWSDFELAFVKKLKMSTMTPKMYGHTWWNFSLAFCLDRSTLLLVYVLLLPPMSQRYDKMCKERKCRAELGRYEGVD